MNHTDWKQLEPWQDTQVISEDGRIPICFGLAATLYFHEGHSEDKRHAALDCFNEFDELCGSSLRWHRVSAETSRFNSVKKLRSRDMSPYLLSRKWDSPEAYDHAWSFYWHGGRNKDDASDVRIHAYGSPKMYAEVKNSLSFLQVSVPILWYVNRQDSFPDLILRWCTLLEPLHGYGGIMLLSSPDRGLTQKFSPNIAGFGERYPGIEIDRPMSHKLVTHSRIKGGNWLTILSSIFVEKLGGRDHLLEMLGKPFEISDYTGGLLIRAGEAPEVGDRNKNIDTPLYRHLARALSCVRIEDHPRVYPKGKFGEEGGFSSWIARFDDQ